MNQGTNIDTLKHPFLGGAGHDSDFANRAGVIKILQHYQEDDVGNFLQAFQPCNKINTKTTLS